MNGYILEQMHGEAKRELNLRKAVYPRWVQNGKLHAQDAKDQTEKMQAIVDLLGKLIDERKDKEQARLF